MKYLGLMILIASANAMSSSDNLEKAPDVKTLTALSEQAVSTKLLTRSIEQTLLEPVAPPLEQPANYNIIAQAIIDAIIRGQIAQLHDPLIIPSFKENLVLGNFLTVTVASSDIAIYGIKDAIYSSTASLWGGVTLNFVVPTITIDFGTITATVEIFGVTIPFKFQGLMVVTNSKLSIVLRISGLRISDVTADLEIGKITPNCFASLAGVDITDWLEFFVNVYLPPMLDNLSDDINKFIENIVWEQLQGIF